MYVLHRKEILKTWTIESIHPFLSTLSRFFILARTEESSMKGDEDRGNRLDKLGQLITNGREI